MNCNWPLCSMIHNEIESLSPPLKADLQYVICFGQEMLWGGRWEGGSCLGTHVRIKDFKI